MTPDAGFWVRVVAPGSSFRGNVGEVVRRSRDPLAGGALSVRLERKDAPPMTFYEDEVEPAAPADEGGTP